MNRTHARRRLRGRLETERHAHDARHAIAARLTRLRERDRSTIVQGLSELLSNAAEHGHGVRAFQLTVRRDGSIRIALFQDNAYPQARQFGRGAPLPAPARLDSEQGRGLAMVRCLLGHVASVAAYHGGRRVVITIPSHRDRT